MNSRHHPLKLRPFFSFYGGKWRDTPSHYPEPAHTILVEPFAGSAGYALRHPSRRVVLCDVDPIITGVWDYLIKVSASEILAIPDIPEGGRVSDLGLCQEAAWLVGFWVNRGVSSPRNTPSSWMRSGVRPGSHWGARVKRTIASQVGAIRHWKVYNVSYEACPVRGAATWFVDPPYQQAGCHYRFGSKDINFEHLGEWCRNRGGQVIVCENFGADWLPFKKITDVKSTRKGRRSVEAVWINTGASTSSHACNVLDERIECE